MDNDAGLSAYPSGRFAVNGNHFQLAMLAYNLDCWLMLFNRERILIAQGHEPIFLFHPSG